MEKFENIRIIISGMIISADGGCKFPGTPVNGKANHAKSSYAINEVITYECDLGYTLVGHQDIVCQKDGHFSSKVPLCKSKFLILNERRLLFIFISNTIWQRE